MKIAVLSILLLLPAGSARGAECNCPPPLDWQRLEGLALSFADEPGAATAEPLLEALPVGDLVSLPPESPSLARTLARSRAIGLASLDESTPWAMQLGLRFLHVEGLGSDPDLTARISDLATTAPAFFLRELARFSEDNSCVVGPIGIVSFFGPSEAIVAGAEPSLEDLTARIESLASVQDAELLELRNWCLERLEIQRERSRDAPRVLRRVRADLSQFHHLQLRSPLVIARATVGIDGWVRAVEILRSAHPEIDEAVAAALRQWRFEPKLEEGRPVEFTYVLTVRSHLF